MYGGGSTLVGLLEAALHFVQAADVSWLFCCQGKGQRVNGDGGNGGAVAGEDINADYFNVEQLLTLKGLLLVLLLCLMVLVIVICTVLKRRRSMERPSTAQTNFTVSTGPGERKERVTGTTTLRHRHAQLGNSEAELHQNMCVHSTACMQQLPPSNMEQPVKPSSADNGTWPQTLIGNNTDGMKQYHNHGDNWTQQCVDNSARAPLYHVDNEVREQHPLLENIEAQRNFLDTDARQQQGLIDIWAQLLLAGSGQQQRRERVSRCIREVYIHEGSAQAQGPWSHEIGAARSVLARVVRPVCLDPHGGSDDGEVVYLSARIAILGQPSLRRSLSSPCL